MPPANMAATVTKLDFDNVAIPLIPCPDVQPPAILAPTTRATPPIIALILEIGTASGTIFKSKMLPKLQLPPNTPRTKIMGPVEGHGSLLLGENPRMRLQYLPILSYAPDTPIADPVRIRDAACADPMARPPIMGFKRGEPKGCGVK